MCSRRKQEWKGKSARDGNLKSSADKKREEEINSAE